MVNGEWSINHCCPEKNQTSLSIKLFCLKQAGLVPAPVGIFDTRKFIFKEARLTAEVRKIFVPHQLLEGANGALMLIKPTTGIFLYNEQRNEFLPAPDAFPMPSKWYLNGVRWDEKIRKYWITSDSWIVQFDPATNQLNYRGHTFTSTATGNMLNTMIGRSFLLN